MRIVFAGTPDFAAFALRALHECAHEPVLVLTQPDRPAGRGQRRRAGPVKVYCESHGLSVLQPESLKAEELARAISDAAPDVMVVAAYGHIVPQRLLDMPRYGAINIHASLLPRWRGAAPIQRCLLAGDTSTGITIMQMDAGLDTGPILEQETIRIGVDDNAGTLHGRLATLGARMITRVLEQIGTGELRARAQPDDGATYAPKISRADALLDWTRPAEGLWCIVRAMCPAPGAIAILHGLPHKIWKAQPTPGRGVPGEILALGRDGIVVACGEGALRVESLQRAGGKRLGAEEYIAGARLGVGDRFESGL